MSGQLLSFAEARFARRLVPARVEIRVGMKVRRIDQLSEGHVYELRGSGHPDDPVRALVLWTRCREFVPVIHLEPAPKGERPALRGDEQ